MPVTRDRHAGLIIREKRMDMGLSPEGLSFLIHKTSPAHPVSSRTIRRVETTGMVPTVRCMFGIAQAFGMVPSQIWSSTHSRVAA